MRLSSIAALADGRLSPATFELENAEDLAERRGLEQKRGSVVPVWVQEDIDLLISPAMVARLCELYASGELSLAALGYIADAAQLSERSTFLDDSCSDYVSEFTDPVVNGAFTVARAREIVQTITPRT